MEARSVTTSVITLEDEYPVMHVTAITHRKDRYTNDDSRYTSDGRRLPRRGYW